MSNQLHQNKVFYVAVVSTYIRKMSPPKKGLKRKNSTPEQTAHRSVIVTSDVKIVIRKHTQKPSNTIEMDPLPMPRTRSEHAVANCPIFALNDDCLLKLFTYLPAIDLCAVKDTCRRFNALADYSAKLQFEQMAEFECEPTLDGEKNLAVFMQHFGKYIGGRFLIKAEPDFDMKKTWSLLKNCGALNELELYGVNVTGLPVHNMKKTLRKLDTLQFKKCVGRDSDYARIINACVNLRSLTSFVNLTGSTDMLLQHIAHEASHIEQIFFATNSPSAAFVENLAKLQHLPKLNLLFVSCNHVPVAHAIEVLAKRNALECMLLREVWPDEELARALDKLTNLQLCYLQTEFEIPDMVRKRFEKFVEEKREDGFYTYKYTLINEIASRN